jgi:hypothetical protein
LGTGTGSEMRRPVGITIVGGLIFSQMLTLFTTPVIYLALDRLSGTKSHRIRAEDDDDANSLMPSPTSARAAH